MDDGGGPGIDCWVLVARTQVLEMKARIHTEYWEAQTSDG